MVSLPFSPLSQNPGDWGIVQTPPSSKRFFFPSVPSEGVYAELVVSSVYQKGEVSVWTFLGNYVYEGEKRKILDNSSIIYGLRYTL